MTLKTEDNIRDWQSLCKDQMNSSQHPLVDLNSALHQFYGYLVALEQLGFITEEELTAAMEKGRLELSKRADMAPIVTNAQGKCHERTINALRKGARKHGVPEKLLVDTGRGFLAHPDEEKAETKPLVLDWNVTKEEIKEAMREVCGR